MTKSRKFHGGIERRRNFRNLNESEPDVRPVPVRVDPVQADVGATKRLDPSLYRRVLGERFEALPEVLRRFHDAPRGGKARGSLRVERPVGRFRNALASLLGMPEAAEDVPVHLQVVVEADRECWLRWFGSRRLRTVQWARGDLLMEAFGPLSFASALVLDGSCLHYEFQRAWFARVPLPRWLAPSASGSVLAGERGWRVAVRIYAPWFGELVHYEGWVEPE